MNGVFSEGSLRFDFSNAESAERLDAPGQKAPHGMRLADFVVAEAAQRLVIEVKGRSAQRPPPAKPAVSGQRLAKQEWVTQVLVPKARDSYTFLHLMMQDDKPLLYIVVLDLDPIDKALLPPFRDRLLRGLRHEANEPWKRTYVRDCLVVQVEDWQTYFPEYPLARE